MIAPGPEAVPIAIAAYLIGSLPFARIVAASRGIDLEKTGSGAPSVANVNHTLGKPAAALAIIGDVGKVVITVFVASRVSADWAALVAVCVIVGHNWPVFAHFNGGRGMLAALATGAVLMPREFAILSVVMIPISRAIHDTAPPGALTLVMFPVSAWLVGQPESVVLAFAVIAVIGFLRRLTAPPKVRLTVRTALSRLVFDRPDPRRHWTFDQPAATNSRDSSGQEGA